MSKLSRRTLTKVGTSLTLGGVVTTATRPLFAQEVESSVLRYATDSSDIQTLDPHFSSGGQDRAIVDMVFNGLVRFTPGDSSTLEPDLAEEMPSSEVNEDGSQTWAFHLKAGVMTHPAEGVESYELTVEDVLFSFQKAANPDTSGFAGDYANWEFAIGDDGSFQITVPEPLSEMMVLPKVANYSGGYIIPQKAYEALGSDSFITSPIGTGPFAIEEYTPQKNVLLTAFKDFYRGEPSLSAVDVKFLSDATSREFALQAGDVDLVVGVPEISWVERIDQLDGIDAEVFGVGEVVWINLDVEHEVLRDPTVREAIFLAINRDNYAALFGPPISEPIYSVTGDPTISGSLSREEAEAAGVVVAQDIDRAMELLAEAGYPDGFELDIVSSEMEAYRQPYEVLIEELRQVGITVNLEVVQHATMHELIREGRNAITIYVGFRPSADVYLTQFFSTEGGATNFSNFTVDDIRDEARLETDVDLQSDLWKDANIEILNNFAGMGLMVKNQVFAKRERLNFGHEVVSVIQYYPGINEMTTIAPE